MTRDEILARAIREVGTGAATKVIEMYDVDQAQTGATFFASFRKGQPHSQARVQFDGREASLQKWAPSGRRTAHRTRSGPGARQWALEQIERLNRNGWTRW